IIHHTYTNVDGIDDDIANSPLLRHCATQKRLPMHRFQFLYMFLLYAISTLSWLFGKDFVRYFARRIHSTSISKIALREHLIFWVFKLLYGFFYIVVPIYLLGWQPWLTGFLIIHGTMGLVLSIVFQLAHVTEKTAFEAVAENHKLIPTEWAIHEVMTT